MAGYSTPYTFANYIGEWANDAAALAEIQARKWDSTADGTGTPRNGMEYYATGAHQMRMYVAGAWVATGTSASSTLDAAYNASAGAAVITVDAGDVTWNQTGAYSFVVDVSACTGAADGFAVEDGTDYLRATHAAANTLNLMGALGVLNLAASGAATIDSDAAATFSGASVAIDADGGTATIDATGAVSINSSAGAINIGNNAIARNINIGTAGARTISIGNVAAVEVQMDTLLLDLNIDAGTLDLSAGTFAATGDGTNPVFLISSASLVNPAIGLIGAGRRSVGSGPGTIIFECANPLADAQDVTTEIWANITQAGATGNAEINIISNNAGAGTGILNIEATSTINIGDSGVYNASINLGTTGPRAIVIGNTTGITGVRVESGTGGINLNDGIAQLNLDGVGALTEVALASADITPSGALTLRGGGVSQFGDDTGYFAFDGAGALSTSGVTTVDLDASGALQINSTGGAINLGDDADDFGLNLGTAGVRTIAIGSAAATAVNIDAITFSIDSTTTSNMTVTGASESLAIAVVGGDIQKLTLDSAGTGVDSIDITSSVGGIELNAALGVAVTNNATVGGTLTVTGSSTFAAITSTGITIQNANYGQFLAGVDDGLRLGIGETSGSGNRNFIFTAYANRAIDHNHDVQSANPTIWGHSITSPAVDDKQWWSKTHNTVDSFDGIGSGSHVTHHEAPTELADDASFDLPANSAGWCFILVGDSEEYAHFVWDSTEVVDLISNSANVVTTDTDTNLCIFDNAGKVTVRNRLGGARKATFDLHYFTP